jgi:hypothetical protein
MSLLWSRFREKELEVIRRYRTPAQVQQYLHTLSYNKEKPETLRSFRGVVRTGSAHCLEAVITSAVILEQHGYPTLILDLESKDYLDHVVHLWRSKRTGLWGAVAKSRDPGLFGRKAVFRTVRGLVYSYFDPYIDYTGRIIGYAVGDLSDLGGYDWRLSDRNVWKVEQYCRDIPHKKLNASDRRYRYWRKRYEEFVKKFPDRKPLYYDNKSTWLPGYGGVGTRK